MSAMRAGPRLLERQMVRRNRSARWVRLRLAMGAAFVLSWGLALTFRSVLAAATEWLQRYVVIGFLLVGFVMAVMVARRRVLTRAAFSRSWLAALPSRPGVARREALRIELYPAIISLGVVTALLAATTIASGFASAVWAALAAAIIVGAAASYAIPAPKVVLPPPGSRYVPKPASRRGRVLRPSLSALGLWPVRQMFARAQPKLMARSVVPVLLSIGLQSKADTAMLVVGIFVCFAALALLVPAVIGVGRAVPRWLAPLPVAPQKCVRLVVGRSLLVILALSAVTGFLLMVMDASASAALRVAVVLALASAATILIGVQLPLARKR